MVNHMLKFAIHSPSWPGIDLQLIAYTPVAMHPTDLLKCSLYPMEGPRPALHPIWVEWWDQCQLDTWTEMQQLDGWTIEKIGPIAKQVKYRRNHLKKNAA